MIKDIIAANEAVTPNQKELSVLRENFPSCFHADGSFDMVRFSEYVKGVIDISQEGYELKFLGKNYAKRPLRHSLQIWHRNGNMKTRSK